MDRTETGVRRPKKPGQAAPAQSRHAGSQRGGDGRADDGLPGGSASPQQGHAAPAGLVRGRSRSISRAVERRAATLGTRRTVKKEWQAAWLVKAIQCIDLTTLSGDDTPGRVRRLCAKATAAAARRPRRGARPCRRAADGRRGLRLPDHGRARGRRRSKGSGIPVAAVATGFPAGLTPLPQRLAEIRYAVAEGADEIDIVITRAHVLDAGLEALYDEVAAMREACGEAHLKAILATGDLKTLRNVYKASMVAMMAGADFIKTSTGKEDVNATLPVSLVMVRAIRDYGELTGERDRLQAGRRAPDRQGRAELAQS